MKPYLRASRYARLASARLTVARHGFWAGETGSRGGDSPKGVSGRV